MTLDPFTVLAGILVGVSLFTAFICLMVGEITRKDYFIAIATICMIVAVAGAIAGGILFGIDAWGQM